MRDVTVSTRVDELEEAISCYKELAASGEDFRRIAYECAKRIPAHGMPVGLDADRAIALAAEDTIAAMEGPNPPRASKIARYFVVCFVALATGKKHPKEIATLTRAGVRSELAEMKRVHAEMLKLREEADSRPPPDPSLPRRALERMPPKPDRESWPTNGCPPRPRLKPRPAPIESDRCEPICDVMPSETVREYRDAAKAAERACEFCSRVTTADIRKCCPQGVAADVRHAMRAP